MAFSDIQRLHQLAERPSRLILGLMSGTSLDGLDIALCRVTGSDLSTSAEVLNFTTVAYEEELKTAILGVFAKQWVSLEQVCRLNAELAIAHADYISDALAGWNLTAGEIDCIASHGQTIYHAPVRNATDHSARIPINSTLQIGDGDILATRTGIMTISDFRQKHIAAGGEGAPLALYGDYLLFSSPGESRFLLNIGGVSNFTFLPAGNKMAAIISTDTGPGNTLLDACVRRDFGKAFDADARLAMAGETSNRLLEELLRHPFFKQPLPKTTGPELFNLQFVADAQQRSGTNDLSPVDLLATLTRFTAVSIAEAIQSMNPIDSMVYLSGGGSHNPLLVKNLKQLLPWMPIAGFDRLGVNPDAKEALLFAVLANQTLAGSAIMFTGAPSITMGKISLPG